MPSRFAWEVKRLGLLFGLVDFVQDSGLGAQPPPPKKKEQEAGEKKGKQPAGVNKADQINPGPSPSFSGNEALGGSHLQPYCGCTKSENRTTLSPWEATVCRYLQGNHHTGVS